jgi:hypothetical protein
VDRRIVTSVGAQEKELIALMHLENEIFSFQPEPVLVLGEKILCPSPNFQDRWKEHIASLEEAPRPAPHLLQEFAVPKRQWDSSCFLDLVDLFCRAASDGGSVCETRIDDANGNCLDLRHGHLPGPLETTRSISGNAIRN